MRRISVIPALLPIALLLAAASLPAQSDTAGCEIEVTQPQPGQQVASRIMVEGTATLPEGHHLWVFARRIDFEPLWWPQKEASLYPNPEPGRWRWRTFATLGESRDVGWEFDLAVAVFAKKEHRQLEKYSNSAIENKDWQPIDMPKAACPPKLITVTKVRE